MACPADAVRAEPRPLLIVVEGLHDVTFLGRLSAALAASDPRLPDLPALARQGRVVCLPIGGGNPLAWAERLAPLGCPEVHLYDRERPPETASRQLAVERINARPGCRAWLTRRRTLENYLAPEAITRAGGPAILCGPGDCVATRLAQAWQVPGHETHWSDLPHRARLRRVQRAKRWLNTVAVQHMTRSLLDQADPEGDLLGWLRVMAELVDHRPSPDRHRPEPING